VIHHTVIGNFGGILAILVNEYIFQKKFANTIFYAAKNISEYTLKLIFTCYSRRIISQYEKHITIPKDDWVFQ